VRFISQSTARRPLLYLQHGHGENESAWSGQGHVNVIMVTLTAAGPAVPMIIVNDNGMTGVSVAPPAPPQLFR
jgi:hypothetical protein